MKKILMISAIVVGGFVALAAASAGVLYMVFPPAKLAQMVVPQIEKAVGRPVKLQSTGLSLFPSLGVNLKGLEIANTTREGFSQEPFIRLEKFTVSVKLLSLLRGRAEIGKVVFEGPKVLVEVDKKGRFNYDDMAFMKSDKKSSDPDAKKPGGPLALPVPLTLERFEIRGGSVEYNDMKAGQRFVLGSINQRIDLSIDKALKDIASTGELVLGDVSVVTREVPKPLTGLTVKLGHDVKVNAVDGVVTVSALKVSFQKLSLTMNGTVTNLNSSPVIDLRMKTDTLQVPDIIAEIPPALAPGVDRVKSEGRVYVDLRVAGSTQKGQKLSMVGALVARGVSVRHPDFPKPVTECNVDVTFNQDELRIQQIVMKLGENPIAIRAAVIDFKNPQLNLALRAALNLDDVKDIAKLPAGVTVGGKISADIKADGRLDPSNPSKLGVEGRIVLSKVLTTTPALARPLSVDGTVEMSASKVNGNMAMAVGESPMQLEFAVKDYLPLVMPDSTKRAPRTDIEFSLQSSNLNVDDMLPKAPAGKAEASAPTAASDAPLLLAAPLPAVDVDGSIRAQKMTYMALPLRDVKVDVKHRSSVADLGVRGDLYGGDMKVDVHADLRDNTNISATLQLEVDRVQAGEFVSAFNDRFTGSSVLSRTLRNTDGLLQGSLSANARFEARGGTMDDLLGTVGGSASISVRDGKLVESVLIRALQKEIEQVASKLKISAGAVSIPVKDIAFSDLQAEIAITGGQMVIDTMWIVTSQGEFAISGGIGLNGTLDLRVQQRLTKSQSNTVVAVQDKGKDQLKGLLKGTALSGVADRALDEVGIPVDRDGRVTIKYAFGGTMSDPKPRFTGFGAGSKGGASQSQQQSAQNTGTTGALKQQASQQADQLTDQAAKEVEKLGDKAGVDVKKETATAKKQANKLLKKLF